jgi:hypothetical protein
MAFLLSLAASARGGVSTPSHTPAPDGLRFHHRSGTALDGSSKQ